MKGLKALASILKGKVKKIKRLFSGKKKTFVVAKQKFYLQLKMTDPKDPAKLIHYPEGIRVLLMDNGKPLKDTGAKAQTDSEGKVTLAAGSGTVAREPDYHFRIDLEERTYFNIDSKKVVPGNSIKEDDDRNLMELPMIIDTKDGGFHYDEAKLKLKDGMLKNYDKKNKGEGTEADPIILELRFYWYYLQFKFFDRIKEEWQNVPRGMALTAWVDGKDQVESTLKKIADFGYDIDSKEKRIQHYLNLLGFSAGEVKGDLADPKTRSAIESFQGQYGLEVNGTANSETRCKIEEIFSRSRVTVYSDAGSYAVPVWKKKEGFAKVYFELASVKKDLATEAEHTEFDLFLHTKEKSTDPKLILREKIKKDNSDKPFEKLDYFKSRHYYDLPVSWSSRNYWTRYNNSMSTAERFDKVMKTSVGLYPFDSDEGKRADSAKPLIFSFDDVVLVKSDGSQEIKDRDTSNSSINLSADSRMSLFHVKDKDLVLYNPEEAKKPYFTKLEFKENLIVDVPPEARVASFANDFYSIYNKRAAQGSEPFRAAQDIKGCRAALLNDTDCHFAMPIRGNDASITHTRYFAKGTGNYELHYLQNGCLIDGPDGLKRRSFLMVYWNCRYTSAAAPNAVSAAKVRKFETEGMKNSQDRWQDKEYTIEWVSGNIKDLQIKPVFFFEAKKPGFGGSHKCSATVSSDSNTGWMGITSSDMYWKDYKIRDYLGVGPFADIDGKRYETLVVSHELGHGEGKDDDYAYHRGDIAGGFKNAQDGDYSQYYPGMPYQFDTGSMMKDNRAPRMRHLSFFLNWINDASGDPAQLKKFLDGTQYQLVHRYGSKSLHYHLAVTPNDYRDIHSPYKHVRNHNTGTGSVDLALYKLGQDETAYNYRIHGQRPSEPFDGILPVFIKLGFIFKNGSAGNWTNAAKRDWRGGIHQLLQKLNEEYYLTIPVDKHDFKRTYLAIFPIVLEKAGADATTHYDIKVTLNDSSDITQKTGKTLSVGNEVSKNWVANYILGKNDGSVKAFFKRLFGTDGLGAGNLKFIRDWFRTEMGNSKIKLEGGK